MSKPMTQRQVKLFAAMEPGVWFNVDQLYAMTGQTGLTENAAKHANALYARGELRKRKMGEPQWMRPKAGW